MRAAGLLELQLKPPFEELRWTASLAGASQAALRQRGVELLLGIRAGERLTLAASCLSEALPAALAAAGIDCISIDYRDAEGAPRLHLVGDVRLVLYARWWYAVVGAPPCTHTALSGRGSHWWKVERGLQWGAIAFYVLLWCAPADIVLLEHPASVVPQYVDVPVRVVQPYMLSGGGDERKETWIAARVAGPVKLRPRIKCSLGLAGRP